MKVVTGLVCVLMTAAGGSTASAEASNCVEGLIVPADAGLRLAVLSRSAEGNLVGTDQREIRVTCRLDDQDDARRVHIRYHSNDGKGELEITGGPSNNVHITVEIPHQTHLRVRVPA